jgi:hypothetical protein
MPRKPQPKPDNPEQFKRFIEMTREVGAHTDPETLDRVLKKVARSSKSRPAQAGNATEANRNRGRSR